jgi:hypothetical protein
VDSLWDRLCVCTAAMQSIKCFRFILLRKLSVELNLKGEFQELSVPKQQDEKVPLTLFLK